MEKEFLELIKLIVIIAILSILLSCFIKPVVVKGVSMEDTFYNNDYLIMKSKYISKLNIGDIIVFKSDDENIREKNLIKRIIGLEGDSILIKDGKVIINGKVEKEYYGKAFYTDGEGEYVVPEGKFFVLGDNRDESIDSRDERVGFISFSQVKGKVFIKIFSFKRR